MQEATQVGPLATRVIRDELDDQVRRSVAAGARVLTGGCARAARQLLRAHRAGRCPGRIARLLRGVLRTGGRTPARPRNRRPSALANDTPFGLGASAWTRDPAEQERFIEEIESGMVFVNGMVASDPRLPFGGVKSSGYGRELSAWGIREFVNVKSVVVR